MAVAWLFLKKVSNLTLLLSLKQAMEINTMFENTLEYSRQFGKLNIFDLTKDRHYIVYSGILFEKF